jgi:uncharacterized protein
MPRMEPTPTALTRPFWDATREQRLLVQWCDACDAGIYYPRWACPTCLGTDLTWREASGRGELYTFNVVHQAANPMMGDMVPYVIALVDLDEGVRIVTNIVRTPDEDLKVGMAVAVAWEPLSDGRSLPVFRGA